MNIAPVPVAEILDTLAPAQRFDTTAGSLTLVQMCQGAHGFELRHEGARVGAYAIRVAQHEAGRVAWVMAGAGQCAGVDLVAASFPAIEYQARELECSQVAITTIRRGLVRKLQAHGYEITGYTLRKKIA